MYRKKQQRKKRNFGQGTATATHQYHPVSDIELEPGRPQELPDYNSSYGAELPSGAHGVPKVQELDGYIAPPKPSVLPAELPSNVRVYKDDYR